MNCKRLQAQLDAYELGGLGDVERRRVEEHLRGCAACQGELEKLRALSAALTPLPDAAPTSDLWPGVKSRLRPRRRLAAWLQDIWEPALAVAAAVVLAFALMHGSIAPAISPPDTSFDVTQEIAPPDEQLVAVSWQRPFADDAALGLRLALLEGEEDGS